MPDRLDSKQALEVWRGVVTDTVRGAGPDLTARQTALLLHIYLSDGPHTVRGLAHALALAKPAVTRGLDALAALGFVRRKIDGADKRNVLVQRTVKGSVYLTEFGERIVAQTGAALNPGAPE
ncbi:MAG: MarR family winged helix-turn-helix transcriptional regulator [Maricaulaceae bacterium]